MTITSYYDFPVTKLRGRCLKVVDGDTLDMELDLGFHLTFKARFRLSGIDTPEMNSKVPEERLKAHEAKDTLIRMVMPNGVEPTRWPLLVTTMKDTDNFGRWLASIELYNEDFDGVITVNAKLLELGLAEVYKR